jgi:hypothetical protein
MAQALWLLGKEKWFVRWGLAHRELKGVKSIGIDEIHWGKAKRAQKRPWDNWTTGPKTTD